MKNKNMILAFFFIMLAILACNMPGAAPTSVATETLTPIPSETPTPVVVCSPTVTTNTIANVRNGPGQVYAIIGSIPLGGKAPVAGRSFDGTWWYIEFAGGEGGYAWIAGSVTIAECIPSTLASIVAPPAPIVPAAVPADTDTPDDDEPAITNTPGFIILLPPLFLFKTATPTPKIFFPLPPIIINP